jgi:hypothetical protein
VGKGGEGSVEIGETGMEGLRMEKEGDVRVGKRGRVKGAKIRSQ